MTEFQTATFRHAETLYRCLKQKQKAAYNCLSLQNGDIIHVHFDVLWNDNDAKALDAFELHLSELRGQVPLIKEQA